MNVYINDLAAFLPNAPVVNQDIEKILGIVDHVPSRTRRIILRNNKIRQRHYAIDPDTGATTHTNAQLTANAIRQLAPHEGFSIDQIECLSCGTSSPDQIMPGHGPMVHGELKTPSCEVNSAAGICLCGITALKYAYMSIAAGLHRNAVATGSELASTFLRASLCEDFAPSGDVDADLEKEPFLAFDADFLRWMLSDGAGAAFLSDAPNADRPSLRIDWIDHFSFANELETCMYAGATKNDDGSITGWRQMEAREALASRGFLIKQDVKLLNQEIVKTSVDRTLPRIIEKRGLNAADIDWFLPHYSSDYFREELHQRMQGIGFDIPQQRWFSNLTTKGNTGAASIYIILEELFHCGKLRKGDSLLCFIPESGRFSIGYMKLTVV